MTPALPREAPQITTALNSATPPAQRVGGVATPVAPSIHSILADLDPTSSTPNPRQIKAQEEASNQRRMHEDLVDCDDDFFADVVDPDDAPAKPEPLA